MHAVVEGRIRDGDILVIRYEGPRGGPGMREMLGRNQRHRRSRLIGRRRAAYRRPIQRSHAWLHGGTRRAGSRRRRTHCSIEEGDSILIDIAKRTIELEVPAEVIEQRLAKWTAPEPRYKTGVFAKYVKLVSSASEGAITNPAL